MRSAAWGFTLYAEVRQYFTRVWQLLKSLGINAGSESTRIPPCTLYFYIFQPLFLLFLHDLSHM